MTPASTPGIPSVKKEGRSYSVRGDDDSARKRTHRLLSGFTLKKESALRRERRDREMLRDDTAAVRESSGRKPHYVHISAEGRPYGHGVTTWNDAIAKCVRSLDPSYIDIRQQPFQLMEILFKRLDEDFEYSADVNSAWLRTRIGNALSSYRHELIKMIQAEKEQPKWVSEEIWHKLVKLEGSENFKVKSEQMRFANSCRRTKGRTGPLGEVGIREITPKAGTFARTR